MLQQMLYQKYPDLLPTENKLFTLEQMLCCTVFVVVEEGNLYSFQLIPFVALYYLLFSYIIFV